LNSFRELFASNRSMGGLLRTDGDWIMPDRMTYVLHPLR
jgi:hypothetical protein